jgi:acyl carrier protein
MDHQVKIRGFRVELEEIDAVLREHPDVREVVVTTHTQAEQPHIVAYISLNDASRNPPELLPALRTYLKQKLPAYMLPDAFVVLKRFPLSANGKIDRRALPKPDFSHNAAEGARARTPLEETLAQLWCEVLALENVGVDQNFFELGGHSLIATRLFIRIRTTLGFELPLRVLFEAPTIAELAGRIENLVPAAQPAEPPDEADDVNFEEFTLLAGLLS